MLEKNLGKHFMDKFPNANHNFNKKIIRKIQKYIFAYKCKSKCGLFIYINGWIKMTSN